ncbi:MAG: hypothetical protein R2874_03715 [Desulfobacterales bacterium]
MARKNHRREVQQARDSRLAQQIFVRSIMTGSPYSWTAAETAGQRAENTWRQAPVRETMAAVLCWQDMTRRLPDRSHVRFRHGFPWKPLMMAENIRRMVLGLIHGLAGI